MKKYYIIALCISMSTFATKYSHAQCQVDLTADSGICKIPTVLRLNADFGFYQIDWFYEGNLVQSYQAEWDTSGAGTTVAGGNGRGTQLNQFRPSDVEVDDTGNLYISDDYRNNFDTNARVVKWPPLATTGEIVADGWQSPPASHFLPNGIAFDHDGNLYIADDDHERVLKWALGASSGTVYAGGNGTGSAADQFDNLDGICFDSANNLYVADNWNSRIQKWAPGATAGTTVADGLSSPQFVVVDNEGNLYVSEFNNSRILRYAPGSTTGVTVAGDPYDLASYLSAGTNDSFLSHPEGIYIDGLKNLYIADFSNSRVQMWPAGAQVGMTIGGGNGMGTDSNQLTYPTGVTQDRWGNVFVGDLSNNALPPSHRIQRYTPQITDTFLADQPGTYSVVIRAYNGCIITDTISVFSGVQPEPVITINGFILGTGAQYASYQWILNDTIIQGATDSVYNIKANGKYRVIVTDTNGCSDTSDVYDVTNYTNIENIQSLEKQISVYPNPVKDELNIKAPFKVNAAVISIEGKMINYQEGVTHISVKSLPPGMYFLHLTDSNGHILKIEKFVKSRP